MSIVGSVVECEKGVQRQKKKKRSTSGMAPAGKRIAPPKQKGKQAKKMKRKADTWNCPFIKIYR
jgi:hypothetical protein